MAASEAAICNIALARIGVRQFIDDLSSDSEESEACGIYYEAARDAVLQDGRWRFATRRSTLALLDDAETVDSWAYAYSLPADCLDARELDNGDPNSNADLYLPFAVELNVAGTASKLLTNEADAILIYTAKVVTTALFPPLFTQALSWQLASDLCLCLPVKAGLGLQMANGYQLALNKAIAADYRQGREGVQPDSPFILGR